MERDAEAAFFLDERSSAYRPSVLEHIFSFAARWRMHRPAGPKNNQPGLVQKGTLIPVMASRYYCVYSVSIGCWSSWAQRGVRLATA